MSLLTAKSQENLNFKFFQLRKLAIANSIDTNVINNIAISQAHQIIFAAYGNALKVIKISTLLDYEWDKKIAEQVITSYPAYEVNLPYKPSLLSVSGGSNNTLLVFGQNSANSLAGDIYDIPSLLSGNLNPITRIEFPPSISQNVLIQSVAWHPEFAETLFAATTSNGSLVTIGIDHQTKGVQLLAHYTDSFKFTCVRWSPKGKQLVVGGDNGQLTQFKHQNGKNFQKAKIISPPRDLTGYKIINVNWVHSALFQVAYIHSNATNTPDTRIVFVHAPPKATPEFYDYGYVCLQTSSYERPDKMRITLSEIGNILLCLSSLSSEVAVIGCETTEVTPNPHNWQQWMLDDSSRIELSGADGLDAYPCGVAWFKGPSKVFKVNESVSIGGQGWPLVVILSSSGMICPYYAFHFQGKLAIPEPPPSQPLPISVPLSVKADRPDLRQQPQPQPQPLAKSVTQDFVPPAPVEASFTFSLPKSGQEKPKPQNDVTVAATVQTPNQQQPHQNYPQQIAHQPSFQQDLKNQPALTPQQYQLLQQNILRNAQQPQQLPQSQSQSQSQPQPQPQPQTQPQPQPQTQTQPQSQTQPQQQQQQQAPPKPIASEEELRKREQEVMEETFSVAINEEISEFTKTLQKARLNFSKALNLRIGEPEELIKLQSETCSLLELLKTSSDTLKTLDLNMLNGYLLETWAMVQEATTRLEKESDPIYTILANRRSIDPVTARKMREIKKMASEITYQLLEFNHILDQEYDEYIAKESNKKLPESLSSMQMIYQTLYTHHRTIEALKKSLAKYDSYLDSIQLDDTITASPRRKEIQEMIESLKNATIQDDNISINENSQSRSMIKIPTVSKEKREKLFEFFEQRNSVPVRRAILPVDLKSSKMISAVVKAKERLNEIRSKSKISHKSPAKQTDGANVSQAQLKPSDSDLNQTVAKTSEKADHAEDKSLFYSTAIGDASAGDTSRYQSPAKSLSFLSPITSKADPRLQQRPQSTTDRAIFKEPEPADKSTPFVGNNSGIKNESKDDSFSLSFTSTTLTNIASPTPASSTFLFGQSSMPTPSTFNTVTKDISIISKEPQKETPVAVSKESKGETKEIKPTTPSSTSTSTIVTAASSTATSKSSAAFPTFTFSSSQPSSTAPSAPLFSFATSSVSTTPTSQTSTTSTVPVSASKANTSNTPFSFSASGFTFSTISNTSSLFSSPLPSTAPSAVNDTKSSVSTSLFASEKPSSTTGFSFGGSGPSTTPSFSFGGSLAPNTTASTNTTPVTPASITLTQSVVTSTTSTVVTTTPGSNSIVSTTVTAAPTTKPFSFSNSNAAPTSQVTSSVPVTGADVSLPPATTSVFSIAAASEPTSISNPTPTSTTGISSATTSVASTSTTVTPIFASTTTAPAPLNLTSSSSIFSVPDSTATSVTAPTSTSSSFGLATSAISPPPQQVATKTPTSPPLFGGPQNTTVFFTPSTPSSFSLSSQQTDVASPKASEPPPAFNFNAALANLGGQANPENAPKNPFGGSITTPASQNNLFAAKTTPSSTFGSPSMSSSFASQGPTVAQTGFGSFAAQNQPRFGSQPVFGGAPAFGSQPTFGGSPSFGSALPFGKTMSSANLGFGQLPAPPPQVIPQPTATASPFATFANANTPSFGALASQQAPTFGQLAATTQQAPVQQQPTTGSLFGGFGQSNLSPSSSIFGNTFSSAPAFGSPQFSQRRQ